MPVIESQLVNIGIAASASGEKSVLRLNYRSQIYDFVRVFATHQHEPSDATLRASIAQQIPNSAEYLLVREVGYYSLWRIDRVNSPIANDIDRSGAERLALQQASIWLFQELWLQWDELLGDRQLHLLSEDLVELVPHIRSVADLDRLATIDLTHPQASLAWMEPDSIAFARQLYHLTQKKLGHQFGAELTGEILRSMPDELRQKLEGIFRG